MDIPKLKDLIQKVNVIKNYSSLLVPLVIGLVAVLLFVPTQLMSGKLKKRIESESISKGRTVRSLLKNSPSKNQWKVEQQYQRVYESDANQTALLARQSTQRQLLSYKIFPEPIDTSTLIFEEFGQHLRSETDRLIARINARDCPTEAELERNLRSSTGSRFNTDRRRSSKNLGEVNAAITDELCRAKAESASVYANPIDLSGYEFWGKQENETKGAKFEYTGKDKAVEDCWYSQLAYWIIEDVLDTIGVMNSGSNSVFTSPAKRLLAVSFARGSSGRSRVSRVYRGKTADRPSYVLSITDGLTESCTKRLSNDDIDVVHFRVVVVVSAKAVLPFMKQLCSAKQHKFRGFFGKEQEQIFRRNQITILESNITSIGRKSVEHELYRYGEDAVIKLDLICEYIFNKNGYDKIKLELVKKGA